MAKAQVIKQWIEVQEGAISDEPPKARDGKYHFYLFLNHCQIRRTAKGDSVLRTSGVQEIVGTSRHDMDQRVSDFVDRGDVRMLEVEANELPRSEPATPALVDGTDPIYQKKETTNG